jgi:uncharacterized membrane protein (UPF0127 family)
MLARTRLPFATGTLTITLALGCACNRTEEPAAPSSEQATPATATATPATSALTTAEAPKPACTVAFGDPAPIAPKATRCPADPSGNLTLPLGKVIFTDAPSAPQVEVELARDEAARERGLMYRTSMPADHGMLFSWSDESSRTFWMRNTCIPLDMLYISKDGVIAGILEQVPTLNDAPRNIACPVAHVLELNAGWARSHGVAPGMKLTIEG